MRKIFFGKSKVESLDVGFHDCALPKNIVLSPFVYFEFHHKPFETLIEHAKTKLKDRINLSESNFDNYLGKGNHLLKFLRMNKFDYNEFINGLSFFESNALESLLNQHRIDYPFLR
jgi:hypothetical protein